MVTIPMEAKCCSAFDPSPPEEAVGSSDALPGGHWVISLGVTARLLTCSLFLHEIGKWCFYNLFLNTLKNITSK